MTYINKPHCMKPVTKYEFIEWCQADYEKYEQCPVYKTMQNKINYPHEWDDEIIVRREQ